MVTSKSETEFSLEIKMASIPHIKLVNQLYEKGIRVDKACKKFKISNLSSLFGKPAFLKNYLAKMEKDKVSVDKVELTRLASYNLNTYMNMICCFFPR